MKLQVTFEAFHVPNNKRRTIKSRLFSVFRDMNVTKSDMAKLQFWKTIDQSYKAAQKKDPLAIIENGVMNSFINNGNNVNDFESLGKEGMMIESLKKENDSF